MKPLGIEFEKFDEEPNRAWVSALLPDPWLPNMKPNGSCLIKKGHPSTPWTGQTIVGLMCFF